MQADDKPEQGKPAMNTDSSNGPKSVLSPGQKRPLALSQDAQVQIGRRLAAVYDEVLQQPVPDRFRLLLDELDAKTKLPKDQGGGI